MSLSQNTSHSVSIYFRSIETQLDSQYELVNRLKKQGRDPATSVECLSATDLADRVSKLLQVPLSDRLRTLLREGRTEQVALTMCTEVASGKYPIPAGQTRAEAAVRVGLAIVTDGVTIAPIQGVSAVRTKENKNGSEYLSVEFAGPIRSAGGTESAFCLVLADQVRKTLGLEKYNANSFQDEPSRFVEELRVYERDVGSFQYKVTDDDVRKAISNLPVEIDGVWTDNYEVVIHRDMLRIPSNRLRGGALRVLNDGIIGKSKKMLKLLNELGINDWSWLSELSGGRQQGSEETKVISSHFDDVISGRPVLCMPGHAGGFRLRYGRAINTGIHAVGIHPSVAAILGYPIVAGTQIKVDMPGKAASVAFVDTLESPIVRLKDGSVVRATDTERAKELAPKVDSILYLGDILISFGDFLENNINLVPSAYVEEWWAKDLETALKKRYTEIDSASDQAHIEKSRLEDFCSTPLESRPSFSEAWTLSTIMRVPLHPSYLLYWDQVHPDQLIQLRANLNIISSTNESITLTTSTTLKTILEKLGVEHTIIDDRIIVTGEPALILYKCLRLESETPTNRITPWSDSKELISSLSGVTINSKSATFIGVRVGRPEKAMPRKMKPPVHGLFPVGKSESLSRDIINAAERQPFVVEMVNLECTHCNLRLVTPICPVCKSEARFFKSCSKCGRKEYAIQLEKCQPCGGQLKFYSSVAYPLNRQLKDASLRVHYSPSKPLKGVLGLSNELKVPERLEKVLLRQKHGLSVYRDGTIRYDLTNMPLTHFRPAHMRADVNKLRQLGYVHDIHDNQLQNEDQILELLPQDVIIPYEAGAFLVSVAKYIDDLLVYDYGEKEPYYKVEKPEDIISHLVIGLAPHTSVGIVGRVIGYTRAQACFASPYWHSAKRRDCDGDGDSIILLMDALLNFSKKLLPSIIGGLMDAPILIQPSIIPREVQRQAHHMDVMSSYPEEFYTATQERQSPSIIAAKMDIIKHRLGSESQFEHFGFTHDTHEITVKESRSSYSTLTTINEKLDRQIEIAEKIQAVNPNEVVKSVLRTHILPDIIGNTKAFTGQKFRCNKCGAKFRRMPVRGNCLDCGAQLLPNVTRGSVEKYLRLGLRLSQKYDVGGYLRSRFVMAAEELQTLFKHEGEQTDVSDYLFADSDADQTSEIKNEEMEEGPELKDRTDSKNRQTKEPKQRTLF